MPNCRHGDCVYRTKCLLEGREPWIVQVVRTFSEPEEPKKKTPVKLAGSRAMSRLKRRVKINRT
jgi:hypothetical protein